MQLKATSSRALSKCPGSERILQHHEEYEAVCQGLLPLVLCPQSTNQGSEWLLVCRVLLNQHHEQRVMNHLALGTAILEAMENLQVNFCSSSKPVLFRC